MMPIFLKTTLSVSPLIHRMRRLAGFAILSLPLTALAEDWNDTTGNWSDSSKWTPTTVPNGTNANIYNGGTVTLNSGVANIDGLHIGGGSTLDVSAGANLTATGGGNEIGNGGNGTLNISGGSLTFSNHVNLGDAGGIGIVNQSGGTVNFSGQWAAIGIGSGAAGSAYNLSGGTLNTGGIGLEVGSDRAGDFTLSGTGIWNAGTIELGVRSGGNGHVTLNAGTLNGGSVLIGSRVAGTNGDFDLAGTAAMTLSGDLVVGDYGTGTFNQSGGTLNLQGHRIQVAEHGGSGVVNLTAGSISNVGWIHVGAGGAGTGVFNVNYTNPLNSFTTGEMYVGNGGGGNGTVNVTSGKLQIVGVGEVGRYGGIGFLNVTGPNASVVSATNGGDPFFNVGVGGGNGTVNITGGASLHTTNTWFALGQSNGSVGTATVSGTGSTLHSNGLIVGWSGSGQGTLNIDDNAVVTNVGHELSVGRDHSNTSGVINISGGGVLNAGAETRIGHAGIGIVNIDGGTLNMQGGGWAILGDGGQANGTINMSSGAVNVTATDFVLAQNAGSQGTFNQTGGATDVSNSFNVGRGGGTGVLNLDGGTFNVHGWTTLGRDGTGTGTINVTNGGEFIHNETGGDLLLGWNNGSHGYVNVESGGKMTYNSEVRIGVDGGSYGSLVVNGAGSIFKHNDGVSPNSRILIGEGGEGHLTISDSGQLIHGGNETRVGWHNGAFGTVDVNTGGVLTLNQGSFLVGNENGSAGIVSVASGGKISVNNGWLQVGEQTGSSGVVSVSGSGTKFEHDLVHAGHGTSIGQSGNGSLTISDGAVFEDGGARFVVGRDNTGTGLLQVVDGGVLNRTVNNNDENWFLYVGGTHEFGGTGSGTALITGTGSTINTNGLQVGRSGGTGIFDIDDQGALNVVYATQVGRDAGNGTLNLNGGGTVSTGDFHIAAGNNSTGAVNILNGTFTSHGWAYIGTSTGAVGTLNVDGANAVYQHLEHTGDTQVGYNGGTGKINVLNGGQLTTNWWVNVGRGGGSTGTINVDGTGSALTVGDGFLNIGEDGTGTLKVTDHGRVNALGGEFVIARNGGSTGTLLVNTGGEIKTNSLRVGGGTATVTFNDALIIANSNNGNFFDNFNTGNSEIQAGGIKIDTNGYNITAQNSFDGAGGLTKVGAGTATLTTTHVYNGTTQVDGGTLQLNQGGSSGTLGGSGAVVVNNGGTLLGGGTDALGYYNHSGTNGVTVNQGGTLSVAIGSRLSMDRDINSVGGTITSVGAGDGSGSSYTMRDSQGAIYTFTSAMDGTATTFSAQGIGLAGPVTFNVTDGNGAVDLDVTGNMIDNFGTGHLNKNGAGTMRISGNNTYTGTTTLNAGTLLLGASHTLSDSSAFTLNGGRLATGGYSDNTGVASQTSSSIIDMGSGASQLTFADISSWTGVLQVWNWTGSILTFGGTDQLIFTANSSSLDLSNVQFYSNNGLTQIGLGAVFQSDGSGTGYGELVPVPEPGAIAVTGLLSLAILQRETRRRRRLS